MYIYSFYIYSFVYAVMDLCVLHTNLQREQTSMLYISKDFFSISFYALISFDRYNMHISLIDAHVYSNFENESGLHIRLFLLDGTNCAKSMVRYRYKRECAKFDTFKVKVSSTRVLIWFHWIILYWFSAQRASSFQKLFSLKTRTLWATYQK